MTKIRSITKYYTISCNDLPPHQQTVMNQNCIETLNQHAVIDKNFRAHGSVLLWWRCDMLCTAGLRDVMFVAYTMARIGDTEKAYTQSDSTEGSTDLTPLCTGPTQTDPDQSGVSIWPWAESTIAYLVCWLPQKILQ